MTETLRDPVDVRRSTRRWQIAGVWVFLVLVLSFPAYRFTEGSRRADAELSQNAAQIATGQELWSENCATCHGKTGEGVTAPALNSQEFLSSVTDQQIAGIVEGGVPGSAMPAWLSDYGGALTQQQIEAIVTYVRSWQPTAPSRPDWRTPSGG
ncbi:MAG TPA: c-type cytochrome [Actinomycetota bacterium]|jgi:mono/diheme cytochrome c family protein|nr:c-type cytochrome [Actinomycetota bacterium]